LRAFRSPFDDSFDDNVGPHTLYVVVTVPGASSEIDADCPIRLLLID